MPVNIEQGPLVLSLSKGVEQRVIAGLVPCLCFDRLSMSGGKN